MNTKSHQHLKRSIGFVGKMNKVFTGSALALSLAVLLAAGCKKSNSNGPGPAGISATVSGTAWQSQQSFGAVTSFNSSYITLTGYVKSGSDSSWFEVDISDTTHVNQPDNNYASSSVYYGIGTSKIYTSDPFYYSHGSITVTSWDKTAHTIAGNFNGVFYNTQAGNDSVTVNNGHFNSTYTVQ